VSRTGIAIWVGLLPAGCFAFLFLIGHTTQDHHLLPVDVGSVAADIFYETNAPYGDAVVFAWDLISEPVNAITGPWGNKTGLFVPAPYGDYGVGRSSSQPTTYIQICSNQVGICLDVQPEEVADQTYNPNAKFYYKWNKDYYTGHSGVKTWLYPYNTGYSNSNPRVQCSFDAAVKTSSGTGVRHANTSFQWLDEESGNIIYVQHYVYDSRAFIPAVSSGYDAKINQLWIAQKLGAAGTFCGTLIGSSVFTNAVWSDYAMFGVDQSWSYFYNMITYLNNKHGISLGSDRDQWRLVSVSFNLEMQQGYDGCIAGKCKDVDVWTQY
jgi:hypothetical protein